tara:strand:+ start:5641 stop:6876 length:1236 start_codon:yes stop_codon:yes gene_type:complete
MAIDYTTIEEVVNDVQLMIDDTSYDKEAQIYQLRLLALQGLRELTFDVEQKVKTDTMLVDSTTLQCALPADYVKELRIGFRGDDDEFHPLGYKSNLSLDATIQSVINDDPYDENNPYYHTEVGRKYGIGGGQNTLGYYRVNRQDGTINFSSDVAGKTVFMEYISDGVTATPGKDHIIKFSMAPSIKGGANAGLENYTYMIKNGSVFKIPSRNGGSITYIFKDSTENPFEDLTSNPSSLEIFVPVSINKGDNTSSEEIAEAVTRVINEGHPRYHVAPNDTNITASNEGGIVTIVISNLLSAPKDLLDPDGTFDANVFVPTNPQTFCVLQQSLIQLGSAGDVPKIHKFCEEALRSYMYYKYIQRKRGIPANEKQMAKRSYFNEKRLARARMMNFNKEAAMQISRKAFKQSPKM